MWDKQRRAARKGVIWSAGASNSEIENSFGRKGSGAIILAFNVDGQNIFHILGWFLHDTLASMLAVNIRTVYPQGGRVSVGFRDRVAGQSSRK